MDYTGLVQVAVLLYCSILVVIAGCSATHLTLTVHCGGVRGDRANGVVLGSSLGYGYGPWVVGSNGVYRLISVKGC